MSWGIGLARSSCPRTASDRESGSCWHTLIMLPHTPRTRYFRLAAGVGGVEEVYLVYRLFELPASAAQRAKHRWVTLCCMPRVGESAALTATHSSQAVVVLYSTYMYILLYYCTPRVGRNRDHAQVMAIAISLPCHRPPIAMSRRLCGVVWMPTPAECCATGWAGWHSGTYVAQSHGVPRDNLDVWPGPGLQR